MRCEPRTLDDIRALGGHEPEDERMFATVAHISEANLTLYRTFLQPLMKAAITPAFAEWIRMMQPLHLQYEMLSDQNPFAKMLAGIAEQVRNNRQQVSPDNPFLKAQEAASEQIVNALESWGKIRDSFMENLFLGIYGSPALQAAAGIDPKDPQPHRAAPKSALHRELIQHRIDEIKSGIRKGGLFECTLRGLIYVGLARGRVDERGMNALRSIRGLAGMPRLTLAQFKAMAREQFFMLLLDPEATLEAIPALLPDNMAQRQEAFEATKKVLEASGELTGDAVDRLTRIRDLFGLGEAGAWPALRGESLKLVPKPEAPRDEHSSVAVPRKEGQS